MPVQVQGGLWISLGHQEKQESYKEREKINEGCIMKKNNLKEWR